jgi:hypothetical protein
MFKRTLATIFAILISATFSSAQSISYLAHFVDGVSQTGVWISGIRVQNPATSGSAVVSGTITIMQDNGTPFNVVFQDENKNPVGSGNAVAFQIAPGQSRFFTSQAKQRLNGGYAMISSTGAVAAGLIFIEFDAAGNEIGEAGVPSATLTQQSIFVVKDKSDTGVAVVNTGSAAA